MSYAPNTICPSLYRDSAVESSTRNGRLPTAEPHGKTWLRKDIDAVIRLSNTYDDFIRLMKQKGYEIKGDS